MIIQSQSRLVVFALRTSSRRSKQELSEPVNGIMCTDP
jgi:hypothetical protein